MTDNATPKTPRNYSRPTKFPAAIPRTMTTQAQRDAIDALVAQNESGIGEVVRMLIDEGLASIDYDEQG